MSTAAAQGGEFLNTDALKLTRCHKLIITF